VIRSCDACGQPYEFHRPSSRFCSARCRNRAHRTPAVAAVPVEHPAASDLADAVQRTLVDAGQLDSVAGQLALALAEAMAMPGQTGSAISSLSRELRGVMGEVTASAATADIVDDLRRRRDARLAHLS
jgi:hypothetical protein